MPYRQVIAILLLLAVYHLVFFSAGIPDFGTLGFALFVATSQTFIWISLWPRRFNLKPARLAVAFTLASAALTTLSLLRANSFDRFYLSTFTLGLTSLTAYLLSLTTSPFGAISQILFSPLLLFISWASQAGRIFSFLLAHTTSLLFHRRTSTSPQVPKLIVGSLITFPFAFILLSLLASADPVFADFLSRLANFRLPQLPFDLTPRIISTLAIILFATPLAYLTTTRRYRSPFNLPQFSRFATELLVLTASTLVILTTYLLVQFPYLFALVPETQLSQFGIHTYSEYVRRGFVELSLVGALTYLVSGLAFAVIRTHRLKNTWLKKANLLLLAEIILFVLSIFRRLYLYQLHHGLTRVRVYGSALLLVLVGLSLLLILRHLFSKPRFYLYESALVILAVFTTSAVNVDHLIARRFPPTVNSETDYTYIARLSPDVADSWLQAYDWASAIIDRSQDLTFQTASPDQKRHLYYARQILYSLKFHYIYLNRHYGTETTHLVLTQDHTQPHPQFKFIHQNRWFHTNFQELQAYRQISSAIDPQEILHLDQSASQLTNLLISPADISTFDRNLNSPLL